MVVAYIGLGANLGNRRRNLLQAWAGLGRVEGVTLLELSRPYRSAPVNMASKNWFINAVGRLQTSLTAEELLESMLAVEAGLGRKRDGTGRPSDRTVDLDLLYWGNMICHGPRLILPHPEIAERLFVLLPLAEIGPEERHPMSHKTSVEMVQEYLARRPGTDLSTQVLATDWPAVKGEVNG